MTMMMMVVAVVMVMKIHKLKQLVNLNKLYVFFGFLKAIFKETSAVNYALQHRWVAKTLLFWETAQLPLP